MARLVAVLLFVVLITAACGGSDSEEAALPKLKDQYQVLVSFTDSPERMQEVANAFRSSPGFEERDIAWFVVGPDRIVSNMDEQPGRDRLERLHSVEGFQTVLLGYDGQIQASQLGGLDIQTLIEHVEDLPDPSQQMSQ